VCLWLGAHVKFVLQTSKSVGVIVCEFRRRAGVSQEQLAADCGFDRTYISRLERGILNPTAIRLWKIADSLETPFYLMVKAMESWVAEQENGRAKA
jgi:transcriptional regulator with XRE-family HTH domain